ncbi:MAG: hypothetical protein A2138_15930 [Deltaproteobacteria bacterium RBG_16_71_12]|nr:MAG: hypothetical protein A2138_15930 [Deltaproteobacteria bacterium RBG_16_71_12]
MLATSTQGSVTLDQEIEYDAWGASVEGGAGLPSHRFLDEIEDAHGFYVLGKRTYDPTLRRWLSPDPLLVARPEVDAADGRQLSLYAYAANNPVRFVDLQGLAAGDPFATKAGALADAAKHIYPLTQAQEIEFAAVIYKSAGSFSYTEPNPGTPTQSVAEYSSIPKEALAITDIHSHVGSPDPSDTDYEANVERMRETGLSQATQYILLPDGSVVSYTVTASDKPTLDNPIPGTVKERPELSVPSKDMKKNKATPPTPPKVVPEKAESKPKSEEKKKR